MVYWVTEIRCLPVQRFKMLAQVTFWLWHPDAVRSLLKICIFPYVVKKKKSKSEQDFNASIQNKTNNVLFFQYTLFVKRTNIHLLMLRHWKENMILKCDKYWVLVYLLRVADCVKVVGWSHRPDQNSFEVQRHPVNILRLRHIWKLNISFTFYPLKRAEKHFLNYPELDYCYYWQPFKPFLPCADSDGQCPWLKPGFMALFVNSCPSMRIFMLSALLLFCFNLTLATVVNLISPGSPWVFGF